MLVESGQVACIILGLVAALAAASGSPVSAQDAPEDDHDAASAPAKPGDMMHDSPVTFPEKGALPALYPPDVKVEAFPAEKDYFLFRSPCRSLAQIGKIQAEMPKGRFTSPPKDWTHLAATRRILTEGGELRLLAVGDSIVNDTMRSGWVAKLREAYPKANIQATVYVRGGGGCQHYKAEERVARFVLPHKPNLVLIGGISQRDMQGIRDVIHQLRAGLPGVEILLFTGAFGASDPRCPEALAQAPCSGTGSYGESLKKIAGEERCAYLDMTTLWAEYVTSSKQHPHVFHRDVVHANEYGEQILSRIMMAFFGTVQAHGAPETTDVFVSGAEGINTYRIPSMLRAPNGALLVFCEARKESVKDASPTALVLRRSLDNGRNWLPMQTLVRGEGSEAIMNPCPVVDRSSNTIILFCIDAHKVAHGHHRHLMLTSADNGETWDGPVDAAQRITGYDDTFVSGPGVSIQLTSGRLVIPGYTGRFDSETRTGLYSCVLYSDDHGHSWTFGEHVSAFTNECQAVELKDGSLMLNMRDNTGKSCRAVAFSEDGGQTWSEVHWDKALNECPCQASLIRYGFAEQDGEDRLLFANPDVAGERYGAVKRTRMTVRMSYDEGKTWPVKKLIHPGPSSYSSLARLSDGDIGIVFEGGQGHRREWIRFVRFPLAWLTDRADGP